jgi:transposase InsO family protein
MTHVRTSPYYPQSNGKIERWHKSLKGECIRPGTPLSLEDARRLVDGYAEHYNDVRLKREEKADKLIFRSYRRLVNSTPLIAAYTGIPGAVAFCANANELNAECSSAQRHVGSV